jgi:hypothetical protein
MSLSNPDSYRVRVVLYVPAFFNPSKKRDQKRAPLPSLTQNKICIFMTFASFIQQILSLWSLRKPEYIALLRYQHLHD